MIWIVSAAAAAGVGALGVLLTPRHVRYVRTVEVEAPVRRVYDAIRFQERLMLWSAWPSETGSACRVEGADGEIGARTVFLDKKGERFGHQEVTALEPDRLIELRLEGKGPPQRPVLRFELTPLSADRTRVDLRFDNRIAPPFNALLRLFGVVRWTKAMHDKDLSGLKRFVEPPHLTYGGDPATRLATVHS